MGWVARSGHISQLQSNPDGTTTGRNDCGPASIARYLREWDWDKFGKYDPTALVDEVGGIAREAPDTEWNTPTSIPELTAVFDHYGIKGYSWTTSYAEAAQAQMSICLVNGLLLAPAQEPASWWGGENYPDHWLLWLPYYQGLNNYFNDPLNPNYKDNAYNLGSVAQAFAGAFLLPAVEGQVFTYPRIKMVEGAAINSRPSHDPTKKTVLKRVQVGATGLYWGDDTTVNGEEWSRIQIGAISGYVLTKAFIKL